MIALYFFPVVGQITINIIIHYEVDSPNPIEEAYRSYYDDAISALLQSVLYCAMALKQAIII